MRTFLFLLLSVVLLACTSDVDKLKVGMTETEMKEVVGEPDEIQEMPFGIDWCFYGDNMIITDADTISCITTKQEYQKGLNDFLDSLETFTK